MTDRPHIFATVLIAGVILGYFFIWQWLALQEGYSLGIAVNGRLSTSYDVTFPLWRKVAALAVDFSALVGLSLLLIESKHAVPTLWISFAVALVVGLHDQILYGTMGSPTPMLLLLLLLGTAVLSTFWRRSGELT